MHLSVIIFTHNPREDYLRRTLEALEQQTLPKGQWELLLIDNASKEPLAGKMDLTWHPNGRHVREDELGLTPARLRGIREATGTLLIFVDDDNLLNADFIETALEISTRMPFLGCFGAGTLEPEFEEEPSAELAPYTGMLALRTVTEPQWSNVPHDEWTPWGAGLVVTRRVAKTHVDRVAQSTLSGCLDRKGTELNSGGDDEFSWTACSLGLGRGIFPELKVTHLIDKRRVQRDYLLRIAQGHAFSHTILNFLHGRPVIPPPQESPPDNPGVFKVFRGLITLSPSRFFYEGHRWWNCQSRPSFERDLGIANARGIRLALDYIRKQGLR